MQGNNTEKKNKFESKKFTAFIMMFIMFTMTLITQVVCTVFEMEIDLGGVLVALSAGMGAYAPSDAMQNSLTVKKVGEE